MHVRVALWLVAALWAAITSDVLLEAAENAGYFGALRDADHESLMPAVLLALLALVALVGLVVRERRRGHDALLAVGQRMRRGFAADAFATFALTGLAVVAMESYEQTFGGASLFAAHGLLALNAGVTFGTYFLAATLFVATLVWPLRALAVASDRALQQLAHWLSAYTTLTREPETHRNRGNLCALRVAPIFAYATARGRAPPRLSSNNVCLQRFGGRVERYIAARRPDSRVRHMVVPGLRLGC
jgi:hypothetical protein